MDGTFEFQNAMHGRWKDTGDGSTDGLLSAVHWTILNWSAWKVQGRWKIVEQLEDSGPLNLRRSVRNFSFCCMATCTRMTRTNQISHVFISFHVIAWKSMQFTSRPCGPSNKVCQQHCFRTFASCFPEWRHNTVLSNNNVLMTLKNVVRQGWWHF